MLVENVDGGEKNVMEISQSPRSALPLACGVETTDSTSLYDYQVKGQSLGILESLREELEPVRDATITSSVALALRRQRDTKAD